MEGYRVVTFQSKEVVDILIKQGVYYADQSKLREGSINEKDIQVCGGKTPIWVFQHPAFRFDEVGIRQFCNMMNTFANEMSISSLRNLYMIELKLNVQPVKGLAHNDMSIACIIPVLQLKDVLAIYYVQETSHYYFYNLTVVAAFTTNRLFKEDVLFTKEMYKKDVLPTLSLSKFKSAEDYYDYKSVAHAYIVSILQRKRSDLLALDIEGRLPEGELYLKELYERVNEILCERCETQMTELEDKMIVGKSETTEDNVSSSFYKIFE